MGRLAMQRGDQPEIFPVNFAVDHGSIVFRTGFGTKLMFSIGRRVAFEADGSDVPSGVAWSVVVKGKAWEVKQRHALFDALKLPLFPWHSTPKGHVIRIEPEEVTGRQFRVAREGTRTYIADPGGQAAVLPRK